MRKNKKNGKISTKNSTRKGFYMFSRDLLSSQRYRRCSWIAKGVYCDLLNVLALQPKPGSICLRDFDLRPKNERSLTFRCIQCQKKARLGEYQSIIYFAEAISVSGASGHRSGLIHGLQELYLRGMVIIEGDTMIQPRMYLDNGFELTDEEGNLRLLADDGVTIVGSPDDASGDPDAEAARMQKEGVKSAEKSTEKEGKNPRVGAGDAHAHSKRVGGRVINNNISEDSKGGVGDFDSTDEQGATLKQRTGENDDNSPKPTETAQISTKGSDVGNLSTQDKKSQQKSNNGQKRAAVADNPPTLEEVQAYFEERTQQGKPFRYITAEDFYDACCQSGWALKDGKPMIDWRARCRTFENYRKEHDDRPIGSQQRQPRRTDDSPKQVNDDNFEGQEVW